MGRYRKGIRKYRRKARTYGICGRLQGSHCSHMVNLSREDFRTLVARYAVERRIDRWQDRGAREYNLSTRSSKHLFDGYDYAEVYAYAVLSTPQAGKVGR